jgi:hypothetical protein
MNLRRIRAVFHFDRHEYGEMLPCAHRMHDGMAGDTATYAAPNPPLPAFLTLIQNADAAQLAVRNRTVGAAATRNSECALLFTAMESELVFIQGLADANPGRGTAIIQNAGLFVGGFPNNPKALLTLRNGKQSGSIVCEANVGLLVAAAGPIKPYQQRFFNWESTVDGSKTFQAAPSTPTGKTTISGFTPLTTVGVRVSMTNRTGQGDWSQVITILVR